MDKGFNKEEYLKNEFNNFWQDILGEKQDFFSKMTDKNFDILKAALSNINNIITYNTTIKAIDNISKILKINDSEKVKIVEIVSATKPNDNGYDIEYVYDKAFICEVKCNRPINGSNRFGSAQKNGITKDLEALIYGKSKSTIKSEDMVRFYKFMVIYEFDNKTIEAVEHYISLLKGELKERVILYKENITLEHENVYVLLVK